MATKRTPEWKFVVYPHTQIQRRTLERYVIGDKMTDLLAGEPSGWGGILSRGMTPSSQWNDFQSSDTGLELTNVGYTKFNKDGSVSNTAEKHRPGAGGFHVLPREVPKAAKGSALGSLGNNDETGLSWNPESGTFRAVQGQNTIGLYNTTETNQVARAVTAEAWPAGMGLTFDLGFLSGPVPLHKTGEYLVWVSDDLRFAFRVGNPVALERRKLTVTGNVAKEKWGIWRTFERAGRFDARNTRYRVSVGALGGRLTARVNDDALWAVDATADASEAAPPPGTAPRERYERIADMSQLIGGKPLKVQATGVRGVLELFELSYTDQSGAPASGTIKRTIQVENGNDIYERMVAAGHLPTVDEIPTTFDRIGNQAMYTVTVQARDNGAFSPLVVSTITTWQPVWSSRQGAGVDFTRYVKSSSLNHAHPPMQAGIDGDIVIDNALINKAHGASARALLRDYAPVEISARWVYDDGTKGEYEGIAKGYLMGTSATQDNFADAITTFSVRDNIARLRGVNARVDGRCPPLDFIYKKQIDGGLEGANSAEVSGFQPTIWKPFYGPDGKILFSYPVPNYKYLSFYGGNAVQFILGEFLGPEIADNFNGNGDALRFTPDTQPPLLAHFDMAGAWLPVATAYGKSLSAASLEAQGKLIMMPPFGQDALTWINAFAEDEFCMLTTGKPDRNQFWMDILYGTREEILRNSVLHTISGDDVTKLLAEMAEYETRPENDINRVLVWGKPFGLDVPMAPALFQGEAVLAGNTERAVNKTWERTHIVESQIASTAARARVLAYGTLAEASGAQFVFPQYTLAKGDANCLTGDVYVAEDAGILPNQSLWFRAARTTHRYVADSEAGRTWTTTVSLQTMSRSELRKFKQLNNLPIPIYP